MQVRLNLYASKHLANSLCCVALINCVGRLGERLAVYLSPEQEGIARALIIGDQSGIDDALRESIANAGLAHVLAISGLHLTLVVGSVFFF